jgi:hypothetical protein
MASQNTLCATNVNAHKLNSNNFSNNLDNGSNPHRWVVGYAPSSFSTAAASTVLNFNIEQGEAANHSPLILPKGAFILRAFLSDNGTTITGATNYNVGTNATSATSSTNLFAAVTVADISTGDQTTAGQGAAFVCFCMANGIGSNTTAVTNGIGQAITTSAATADTNQALATLHLTAQHFVTLDMNSGTNTAGDLRIAIEYIIL